MTGIKQTLVIGATENIGRHAVRMQRDRGVAVRGLARDVSGLPGAAAGLPVSAEEAGHDEARAEMLSWAEPGFADAALAYWASLVTTPEPVTDTVRQLTGSSARPFASWARDHAADFRPPPVEEVARRRT